MHCICCAKNAQAGRLGLMSDLMFFLSFCLQVSCVSVVPLLCHFIAECGHDEGGIIVGREVSLTESFSVMNVILVADPITVLTAMEKGNLFCSKLKKSLKCHFGRPHF